MTTTERADYFPPFTMTRTLADKAATLLQAAAMTVLSETVTMLTAALQHIPLGVASTGRSSALEPYLTRWVPQGQTPYPGEVPHRVVLLLAVRTGLGLSDPYGGISQMSWGTGVRWRS